MHYKVRDYINNGILKSMYHAQFESHVHYEYVTWEQNASFPKENIRLIHFREHNAHRTLSFPNQNNENS